MWTFRQTREFFNNHSETYYKNIDAQIAAGEFKHALKWLQQQQKRHPQDTRWMLRLGFIYEQQQQKCLAYHWYLTAAQKHSPHAFYHLGRIELNRQNFKLAEHYLQQAIEHKYTAAYLALGEMYFQLARYQTAIYYLKTALQANHIEALSCLSRIYLLLKDFPQAKKCLEAAFEHDLKYSAYYLATYYQALHHFAEAKDWYIYAFQTEKNLAALENLGQIFCAEGKILYGEKIIALSKKLEQQTVLNSDENALLNSILGESNISSTYLGLS
ncbi:tetratricopeptide repeat protein [Acinetobacter sp. MD2(2019)]|uniref:tetratricopeptide repeat protein n=1 Tax=Acinetobacter sp. MD2(2019) TaxID=2605273 RepID=UPI002D1F027D|nr:tetratricopeptide repeat protein [Acinetobacter sp. MD2(2019)]MEB3754237.1 sel1 repeat family protein [Acinetobacter sp. MD2(2019)]